MGKKYSHIMAPLKIGNVILKSRFLSANALPHFLQGPELYPSDAVVDYLINIAKNGAAIITIGDWTNLKQREGFGDGCHFPMWDTRDPALENALTLMVDQLHFFGSKVSIATHLPAPEGYGVYDGEPAGGMPMLSPAEMEEMMEEMAEMMGGDGAPMPFGPKILWALMLLAWNPEFTWLNKFMQRAVNPYEVLQCRLLNHFNYWSALLLYLMTSILCIASGGTLLRLTGVLGRELGIEKDAARDFVPLGCFFLAFIIYYLSAKNWTGDGFFSLLGNNMRQIFAIGMNSFDLFNLLITVYVFALLALYWRSRQKPFRKYVYIVAVLLGLALAYIIIMWLRWPYGIGVICGLALSLGLMAADFFYRRRQFR